MAYTYTSSYGPDVILAPCLQVLCSEIAVRYPDAINLGEIGDSTHKGEGVGSDHNPFITHGGKGYVRAIDIGGSQAIQSALFAFFQRVYAARDPRVYPYGYAHKDNVITTWFGTGTHTDAGDVGHLHISVTQANGNSPSSAGWVSALDSRAPWGLATTADTGDELDMDTKTLQAAVIGAPIRNPDTKNNDTLGERVLDIERDMDKVKSDVAKILSLVTRLAA